MASFTTAKDTKINEVHIGGLAVLKIIKHCGSTLSSVTGSLLGLSSPSSPILEITSSFPFPSSPTDSTHRLSTNLDADGNPIILARGGSEVVTIPVIDEDGNPIEDPTGGAGDPSADGDDAAQSSTGGPDAKTDADQLKAMTADQYQIEMMKMLRELNVDNNCVGWYQSSRGGSLSVAALVETQIMYQRDLGESAVVLVYDAAETRNGTLGVKAFRVGERMEKVCDNAKNQFVSVDSMLTEIPVKIVNGGLIRGLLYELGSSNADGSPSQFDCSTSRLALPAPGFLEGRLDSLLRHVDDLNDSHNLLAKYSRSLRMLEGGGSRWDQKPSKKAEKKHVDKRDKWEGEGRKDAPPRMESLMVNKQMGIVLDTLESFADGQMEKLIIAGGAVRAAGAAN